MNFSNEEAVTAQEVREKAADAFSQILMQVTLHGVKSGKSAEEMYEQAQLIDQVFELGRSVGKAEAAAEIYELIAD